MISYWLCWNPLLVELFCSNNVLGCDWKMDCWRGWVTDAGSSKSFAEVGSGYKSQLLHFRKKHSVSSEEHGWGTPKPKNHFLPDSEPKANPNPAGPVHFCLDVPLKTSTLPPLLHPPTARSASSRPAFQERGAHSSSHPLPGRLPHTTLPARPTLLPAGSSTSQFTQSFPLSAACSQQTEGAVLHGPCQQQHQRSNHLKLQWTYKTPSGFRPSYTIVRISVLLLQALLVVTPLPFIQITALQTEHWVASSGAAQN